MKTVAEQPAEGGSQPRRGFTNPETARRAASIFADEGFTAADVRRTAGPGDRLLGELADALDDLAGGTR